jgi:hypothetical protein
VLLLAVSEWEVAETLNAHVPFCDVTVGVGRDQDRDLCCRFVEDAAPVGEPETDNLIVDQRIAQVWGK